MQTTRRILRETAKELRGRGARPKTVRTHRLKVSYTMIRALQSAARAWPIPHRWQSMLLLRIPGEAHARRLPPDLKDSHSEGAEGGTTSDKDIQKSRVESKGYM